MDAPRTTRTPAGKRGKTRKPAIPEKQHPAFIRKILVPVDFSPGSVQALSVAAGLAKKSDASLIVLHVYHLPIIDEYMSGDMIKTMVVSGKEETDLQLKRFLAKHKNILQDVEVIPVSEMGFASEIIAQKAKDAHADIIVMGTRGANSPDDKLFGTITWNTLKKLHIPVLAIPAARKFGDPGNIMLPFEGSDKDMETLGFLMRYAELYAATVHGVHFMKEAGSFNKSFMDKVHQRFRRELDSEKLQIHFLAEKNITEAIRKFAEKNAINLICMVTHNKGLFATIFHMSVTRNIALYTEIPLLAYNIDS